MEKRTIAWLIILSGFFSILFSQGDVNIILRDKDVSKFQKIKLYLNILDKEGKPLTKIDSSMLSITESQTGKQSIPRIENFYSSAEPLAILFSADASHSMDGAPINNVKKGILQILGEFRKDDKMGIAYFHDDFFKQASFDTDRDVLRNNINSLLTGGSSTELYKSTIESIKWLKSLTEPKRKILVLISDGEDNGSQYKLEDVLKEVKESGFTVFTIGSTDNDKGGFLQNMEKIAQASVDGKYYKIKSPDDIKNIIPTLYERIKNEYIVTYYSYCTPSTQVNATINLNFNNQQYAAEFIYDSPSAIVENAPSVSFWKTKEFLYGSIGAGALIILLAVFMFINMSKKRQYKHEKEEEHSIREREAAENEDKFNKFRDEYDKLLDRLESQMTVSESDKEHIALIEKQIEEAGKNIQGGVVQPIDYKRRTMILDKGSAPIPQQEYHQSQVILTIRSGMKTGNTFQIGQGVTTLGRTEANIILPDDTVSRLHARIYYSGTGYVIEDLSSTNGTFLNNYKITTAPVKNGDLIRLGGVEILFNN